MRNNPINRRIMERIVDHNKRDKNSHILKHSREESQSHLWDKDYWVIIIVQLSNGRLAKLYS